VSHPFIAAVCAGATAAALGACGGDEPELGPRERAVSEAIVDFTNAVADGDGATACAKLTPRGKERLRRVAKARLEASGPSCAETVERAAAKLPGPAVDALSAPSISNVRAQANRATATIEPPGDLKELALAGGITDVSAEVQLVNRAGAWKLDDFRP
jgi:hypothetical protein